MAHIGVHDAERERIKNKSFPNYALMKISAYHKARGDTVSWWAPKKTNKYDIIYSSKVFDFTPVNKELPKQAIKGGTGYSVKTELPPEIDIMFPDYSLYPECNSAIGYITRGCPNKCRWCVVPEKEGGIKPYRRWGELVRQDSNNLVLMDNNILACEYGISELLGLSGSGYRIDLNQGMDARLVDERIAGIIAGLKWIRHIRFSCDKISQINDIFRASSLLGKYGIRPYKIFIYLLVTEDIGDASCRVEQLKKLKGVSIYAQPERNGAKGITPNAAQLEFSQRYIYSGVYRKESFDTYCTKRRLDFMNR